MGGTLHRDWPPSGQEQPYGWNSPPRPASIRTGTTLWVELSTETSLRQARNNLMGGTLHRDQPPSGQEQPYGWNSPPRLASVRPGTTLWVELSTETSPCQARNNLMGRTLHRDQPPSGQEQSYGSNSPPRPASVRSGTTI